VTEDEVQAIEIRLLLEAAFQAYGYDFRDYAEASLTRRLRRWLAGSGFATFSAAQAGLLRDPEVFRGLLAGITVNVTEMFRDPAFFRCLREQVVPHLKTWPFVRIWVAGCATGEEAYSLAILLVEEGLGERFRIYATDIDQAVLASAEKGIYPLRDMQRFTQNYQKGGGKAAFSDYYSAAYDHALLMPALGRQIVFASHNLAGDSDFGEMHMVLCRNVMIYFKAPLKARVLGLFQTCLMPGGFLCLGLKETLAGQAAAPQFTELGPRLRVYRKRYA
jgi:chemotaxis protein methyltransferase CheR